ncbi:membrane protease YdiL (CAAX protease family) [Pullulanibacillus pueri]|uniref:Peptidase n=1 Tax=Pullulanibacillus pueri TaxID=1437324 RepID=A0A8J2ZX86_9BACL|nr:type II CAAX endopeptidase family protein [Pullulanibacillus pueri]MBM7682828.1 membrane protease YdiL (CAAX protease family) [Pullulanibacillus pueri]GGH83354.1 peptidase [Pullulanibacillus pueri]
MTKRYWWIIITYIVCQLSGLILGTPLLNFIPIEQRSGAWVVFSFLVTLIITLLLLLPERKMHKNIKRANTTETITWAIAGIFLIYITQVVASVIDVSLLGEPPKSENTEQIMDLVRITPFAAFVVAIVGPILEEIIFRKIIFGWISKKTNVWIGAIISALLFALLHMDKHIIIYGGIGCTLAFLYVKTKRIIVPIIAHCSLNTFALIMTFTPAIQDLLEKQQQTVHFLRGLL